MAAKKHLYVYFNERGVMSTQILHGSGPIRQGDTFDLYVLFEQNSDILAENLFFTFKIPGTRDWSTVMIVNEDLGLQQFKKVTPTEITYDLVDGKKYRTFKFNVLNSYGLTDKFGNVEGLVFSVSSSDIDISEINPGSYSTIDNVTHYGVVNIYVEKTYGSGVPAEVTREEYIYLLSEIASLYKKMASTFVEQYSENSLTGEKLEIINDNGALTLTNEYGEDEGKIVLSKGINLQDKQSEIEIKDGIVIKNDQSGITIKDGILIEEVVGDKTFTIRMNEQNGLEIVSSDSAGSVARLNLDLAAEKALFNGVPLADNTYVSNEVTKVTDEKFANAIAAIQELGQNLNSRIDSILEGADVDFDTFKEISDQIKEFMAEHEDIISLIEATKTKIVDIQSENVTYTFRENEDATFTSENIQTMTFTIPSNIKHGFYTGVNFKTGNVSPAVVFINDSNKNLELVRNGRQISTYVPNPGAAVRMFVDCDGKYVYITIQELNLDAIY